MGLTWREPTTADAEELGRMHLRAWLDTYGAALPDDYFVVHDLAWSVGRWRDNLATALPEGSVRLAVFDEEGAAAGWTIGAPSRERGGHPARREWELWGLYVARPWLGTGLGSDLLRAAVADRPCELWVWEGNERARAFYGRNGFVADGARFVDERFPDLPEIRMVR